MGKTRPSRREWLGAICGLASGEFRRPLYPPARSPTGPFRRPRLPLTSRPREFPKLPPPFNYSLSLSLPRLLLINQPRYARLYFPNVPRLVGTGWSGGRVAMLATCDGQSGHRPRRDMGATSPRRRARVRRWLARWCCQRRWYYVRM